jgi:hypothetical protein
MPRSRAGRLQHARASLAQVYAKAGGDADATEEAEGHGAFLSLTPGFRRSRQ